MDFDIRADQSVKIKENGKINKNLDLSKELRKWWEMKVTGIPIMVGTLEMVPKEIKRTGTIKTMALKIS